MSMVAGPWRSVGGGPVQRDVLSGPGAAPNNDPLRALTLAVVYPAVVYARPRFGDDWTMVTSKDEADAFLRAHGWELIDEQTKVPGV